MYIGKSYHVARPHQTIYQGENPIMFFKGYGEGDIDRCELSLSLSQFSVQNFKSKTSSAEAVLGPRRRKSKVMLWAWAPKCLGFVVC